MASGPTADGPAGRRAALRRKLHPEVAFGGFSDLDGTVMFYARVQELLPAGGVALDIGCGRGTQQEDPVRMRRDLRSLRGRSSRVIGVDVDPAAAQNRFVDEFRELIPGEPWPVADGVVDLAVADFVVEHVVDPADFFAQAARVLVPGGHLCLRTVNTRSYLGLASRLVPASAHAAILARTHSDRAEQDVFPTLYRCNTRPRLAAALAAAGFDAAVYGAEDEPSYLAFNALAYRLGLLHRRLAPSAVRIGLVAFARRV